MGYAIAIGPCVACSRSFGFNPVKVPSVKINGVKEPICKECVDHANTLRMAKTIPLISYDEDAYGPCDENDLDFA